MKKLLLLSSLLFLGLSQVEAQSSIEVTGEATVKVVPELLQVQIPLQAERETYSATSDALIKTYNDLSAALVKAGIDKNEIKSSSLSIQENYTYTDRERKLIGYVGSIQIRIELKHEPKTMAAIMSTLGDERFKFGYNFSFSLSESQKSMLLEKTLKDAVADGHKKAEILADATGVKIIGLKEAKHLPEGGQGIFEPIYRAKAEMMDSGSGQNLSLNPQEMEIRKEVLLVYVVAK